MGRFAFDFDAIGRDANMRHGCSIDLAAALFHIVEACSDTMLVSGHFYSRSYWTVIAFGPSRLVPFVGLFDTMIFEMIFQVMIFQRIFHAQ